MLLPFSKSTVRPLLILDRSLAGGWVAGTREEFFGPDRFGRLDRQVPTVQDFHFRSDDAIVHSATFRAVVSIVGSTPLLSTT